VQPAPVPVLSATVSSLSAAFGSTACWSIPLSVKDQVSDTGEVSERTPVGLTVTGLLGGEGPSVVSVCTVTV
jgi:hypothetical protein